MENGCAVGLSWKIYQGKKRTHAAQEQAHRQAHKHDNSSNNNKVVLSHVLRYSTQALAPSAVSTTMLSICPVHEDTWAWQRQAEAQTGAQRGVGTQQSCSPRHPGRWSNNEPPKPVVPFVSSGPSKKGGGVL